MNGIFITATDTGVGKTIVTGMLAKALIRTGKLGNLSIDVWKPVQSGAELHSEDADSSMLHRLSGLSGDSSHRVGSTYQLPLAPWIAARRVGEVVPYDDLLVESRKRLQQRFCLVEGAGGVFVPLTERHTLLDFAMELELPVLIVARPGLGTVNHTLLTIEALRSRKLSILGVVINGVTDQHDSLAVEENIEMIEKFGRVKVVGVVPYLQEQEMNEGHPVFEHILGRILK